MSTRLLCAALFVCGLLFSAACVKDFSYEGAAPAEYVDGVLHWSDPAGDGAGLTYLVDSTREVILFQSDLNAYQLHARYSAWVDVPSRLYYKDTGATGCVYAFVTTCGYRLVTAENLVNR